MPDSDQQVKKKKTKNSQAELVDLARSGDVDAFSRLMETLQPRLLAQAIAFCRDPDLARDLVQETMIAAWKSLKRFDGSSQLFTWLYVILLRQHRRTERWFSRRIPSPTASQIEAASQRETPSAGERPPGGDGEDSELIRSLVARLPRKHREVVRLRFYAEASEAEIAGALGISPGTVKSRLHHAMKKMRRMKETLNHLHSPGHSSTVAASHE